MERDDTKSMLRTLSRHFWEMLTEGNPEMTVQEIQAFLNDNEGMSFDYLFKRIDNKLQIIPQIKPTKITKVEVAKKKFTPSSQQLSFF